MATNIFNHFSIVHELVKYIKWNDIHSLKKLNSLCNEVCDREMQRRCHGIMCGYVPLNKADSKCKAKRLRYTNVQYDEIQAQIQCYNPKLVLLFTNKKGANGVEDIIKRQCNSDSVICRLYSNRGCLGCSENSMNICTSTRNGGIWWLCLPREVDVRVVLKDNAIMENTKLILVFNASASSDVYGVDVFKDRGNLEDSLVLYCGGLVRVIEIYNHDKNCFEKKEHVSIAIGGDGLHLDYIVMDEDYTEAESIRREFTSLKGRVDNFMKGRQIRHQCALVFSCFLRNTVKLDDADDKTEYDLFREFFPGVTMQGVFCEGEIFHVRAGVLRLLRSLEGDSIDGLTSIYVLMSWWD